ncbi:MULTISPECIES: PPA1309 family protein [Thermomonospora]|nr:MULTISPECIES: PPA1309 family protein [Thermomonospora]PKK12324.1 MAG: hypothetical protein BUE48_018290 [Thermomonospora sp. CIF 1]
MDPVTLLEEAVLDLERHAAAAGWDAPPRLYALVESAELLRREPALAERFHLSEDENTLVVLEQEALPHSHSIEEALARIAWPPTVAGCALVIERIILPPDVEEEMPEDEAAALEWAASHPRHDDVRIVVGVLRDGERHSVLRVRRHDTDEEVLSGPDLVPALADQLAATLEPDLPEEPEQAERR